ncbi:MAG: AmmeMemoRadiSam system protein B [Bradymonadaceae bacterium]
MTTVREPACAGRFYPAESGSLRRQVEGHLDDDADAPDGSARAVIAPHAGYRFSGPTAGRAFGWLAAAGIEPERVLLVGPSHFERFEGLAVPSHDAWSTPLGPVDVDRRAVQSLSKRDGVAVDDTPHRREHSLETHLPFLQVLFDDPAIVPIVTGRAPARAVAAAIEEATDDATVVSISSDLSHYLDYETAREIDDETRRAIEDLSPESIDERQACGSLAIRGWLLRASAEDCRVETLDMRNSGDTAGGRDEVVGYGAWGFSRTSA